MWSLNEMLWIIIPSLRSHLKKMTHSKNVTNFGASHFNFQWIRQDIPRVKRAGPEPSSNRCWVTRNAQPLLLLIFHHIVSAQHLGETNPAKTELFRFCTHTRKRTHSSHVKSSFVPSTKLCAVPNTFTGLFLA